MTIRSGRSGVPIEPDQIGARLRVERTRRGLSQRKLAQLVGVSPSLISQMESGKVQPSVATLFSIVTELGLSIDQLIQGGGTADGPSSAWPDDRSGRAKPVPDAVTGARRSHRPQPDTTSDPERRDATFAGDERMVQRSSNRATIRLSGGVTWERLTPDADHLVDFLYVTYDPGACSSQDNQFLRHEGREYLFMLSGDLEIQVAFETNTLTPGDSITFDAMRPHRLTNNGAEPAVAVVAIVHH